ncbi:MAG: M48 family metallopeptidase [Piscinibacter sp.]|nr:M48 family metallopeptidase [Piscinibacter sp.]
MKYLVGYPPDVLAQVRELIATDRAVESLARRYPESHDVVSDGVLYDYVAELKSRYMRNAGPLAKVVYDNRLHLVQQALGTHTTVSRVQGGNLKAKREIRIASLFRQAPAAFLRMIVVHELAHLKEREHGKAFYALCTHMEPTYHQLEFDVRLWLTLLELAASDREQSAGASPAS